MPEAHRIDAKLVGLQRGEEIDIHGIGVRRTYASPPKYHVGAHDYGRTAAVNAILSAIEDVREQKRSGEYYRSNPRKSRRSRRSNRPCGCRHNPSPLFETIRVGDRVTILTPQGQRRTGRAVMRGPHGWVLNLGGQHGTPGIATERNTILVKKGKGSSPSHRFNRP